MKRASLILMSFVLFQVPAYAMGPDKTEQEKIYNDELDSQPVEIVPDSPIGQERQERQEEREEEPEDLGLDLGNGSTTNEPVSRSGY